MEYRVQLGEAPANADRLESMLTSEDPAAVCEVDGTALQWRVSTSLGPHDLVALLGRAGVPTPLAMVRALPSVCCGGCSG